MSDISIPGTSTDAYKDVIDVTLKASRPYQQKEAALENIELYKKQKTAWQTINRSSTTLRTTAQSLYSFENPFDSYTAISSDDKYLTAQATREAMGGIREIEIIQTASPDKFLSRSLDKNMKIEAGTYTFVSGNETISFKYKGGSLKNFVQTLNRRGKGLVTGSLLRNTSSTMVMTIEGSKSGVENRLEFLDDAFDWGLSLGIIKQTQSGARNYDFPPVLNKENCSVSNGVLTVLPGGELEYPFNPAVEAREDYVLELTVSVESLPREKYIPPEPPPGPRIPSAGNVEFSGILVENAPSKVDLPPWTPPPPPPYRHDMEMVSVVAGDSVIPLGEIIDSDEKQVIRLPLEALGADVTSLKIRNNNTHNIVHLERLRTHKPGFRGDYAPARPVKEASDSRILLDGVEITRSSNTIDDLLPGLTLNLKKTTEEPIELTVEADREKIKDEIIKLVAYYDQMVKDILIYTSRDESIIDEIDYLEKDEIEQAREQLGIFQSDSALLMLKSKMQTIMMNAYPTSDESEITLLAQLGISTNATSSSGINSAQLRGYLEIDEEKLDSALQSLDLQIVKELFGYDTDNDLVIDSGVAWSLNRLLKAYDQTGGIIANRISTLDSQLSTAESRIATYDRQLERKEQQLKEKYGQMDAALKSLDSMTESLNNLGGLNKKE